MQIVSPALCPDPARLPPPGRPAAVAPAIETLRTEAGRTGDKDLAGFVARLATDPVGSRLLAALFGNSPYLTRLAVADPSFLRDVVRAGPDGAFQVALMSARAGPEDGEAALMRRLRIAKRRAALAVALADIAGAWPLARVTGALSDLAEAALQASIAVLLRGAAASGDIGLADEDDPARDSGLFILGMGKLGARELNYSSDVDLIVLYDTERVNYKGKRDLQHAFVRLTRALVRILSEHTSDGYVFRTDLRLRPDPGATPPALSVQAAESYYESIGQNWERAAMIKARPVAGDLEAGAAFLDVLRPFMWRKNLDFAAIEDIHSIKRQIHAHRGGRAIAVAGHNIKLGRGGIREIEFFAQTQQLIWGGRNPGVRQRETCPALDALAASGQVSREAAERLKRAYEFLRKLEHRLQMTADQQTHTLPGDAEDLAALAAFMGFGATDGFTDALLEELRAVETIYAGLFEESPDLSGPGNLVFTGNEDDPGTLETLARLGFESPERVTALVRGWHHGRFHATRSNRARQLLTELVPVIVEAFAKTVDPDAAFLRFNDFLGQLPAGVQLFSLFHSHPELLDLVAEIMGSAPRMADTLSRQPILLDAVLTGGFLDPAPSAEHLAEWLADALREARDFQDVLDGCRRWANDRSFQLGIHLLRGISPVERVLASISDVADALLRALFERVAAEFAGTHGSVPGGGMAVVALGKLGGREMTLGSDLDLLLIYDAPEDSTGSDGARPLSPGHYYARLSQRLINAVTAPTGEGRLYEVDMRLRPSGNAGPIASLLSGFVRYQTEDAWTWEHMVLTRARFVAGPETLGKRVETAIQEILTRKRDPAKLRADVIDMHGRIQREHGTHNPWAIKHYPGGLVDIEFLAQYLQLLHAHDRPEVLAANTTDALDRLGKAGVLDPSVAGELIETMHLWRSIQALLRLSVTGSLDEEAMPEGLRTVLARGAGEPNFAALKEKVLERAADARRHFESVVGVVETVDKD